MSKSTTTTLYARICAFLKVNDEGKVEGFLQDLIKKLNRTIDGIKQNVKNLQFQLETETAAHQDRVEDLTQAVEDAYLGVDVSRIQTNADRNNYQQDYLSAISRAEAALESENESFAKTEKSFTDRIEAFEKQIANTEARIARLQGQNRYG